MLGARITNPRKRVRIRSKNYFLSMKRVFILILFFTLSSSCKKPRKGIYQIIITNSITGISSIPYIGEEYKVTSDHIYYNGNIEGVLNKTGGNVDGILTLTNPTGSSFNININGKILKESGIFKYKITGNYNDGTFEILKTN